MKLVCTVRKKAYIAFFLIFFYSCSKPCQEWSYQETVTDCISFNSGKTALYPTNDFRGVEIELVRYAYGSRMYLNIYSRPIESDPDLPGKVPVLIEVNGQSAEVWGDLFEGGQRILLPQEAELIVINALSEDNTVIISVRQYSSEIIPANFINQMQKLRRI